MFVIFLVDGDTAERWESAEVIRELSHQPVFVQFMEIGKEDFPFLRKLDKLSGRLIDAAGFMQINDLDQTEDTKLYDQLLNEFPH
ncbi:MAG TPA: VWA domain-containing protein [Candidatus Competibacter sp.]|nr:VWA domain-containing protein [Candidatus Competibacter sp.]